MSSEHQHRWNITAIRGTALTTHAGEEEPVSLQADLRCCSCRAEVYGLPMMQLKDLIAAGHVRGDSLAQWASISPLFR